MTIEEKFEKLTVEEKIKLLCGASMWQTVAVDRLGIPSITMTDGPHGVRLSSRGFDETKPATVFPVEAAMAATWNPRLIEEAGAAMAEECQNYGVSILLGPGVHEDMMIGSSEVDVTAVGRDGKRTELIKDGRFLI